jgi:hypothetical protein
MASATTTHEVRNFPKLNGKNFPSWQTNMLVLLEEKEKLHKIVKRTEIKPEPVLQFFFVFDFPFKLRLNHTCDPASMVWVNFYRMMSFMLTSFIFGVNMQKKTTRNVVQTDGKPTRMVEQNSSLAKKRESVNRGVCRDSRYVCTYSCIISVPL